MLKDCLAPDEHFTLEDENVPVPFPDGAYAKRGDAIVCKEIGEDVDCRRFDLRLVARRPDITDKGVYWVSFENEDLRVPKIWPRKC